jgi:catechol 2,3-dioxygenase-like lactoylglutathione lyase family enzyme
MNSDNPQFALRDIGQIGCTVSDLERAVVFYRDALGLKHLFSAPPGLAFFAAGDVRLMLSRPEKADSERFSCVIYFKVPDIQSARDALASRGVTFEVEPHRVAKMPDHELWMAFFRDPDRNLMALMCEKRA